MQPKAFPEANRVLARPASMTAEECMSLQVHDTGEAFVSCWQPSEEDRERIAAGGAIWVWVVGRGHPPIVLETASPFAREVFPRPAA